MGDTERHVLGLSGGKDSAALAIYMRDRIPQMEYVFCDTKKELPETYEYLDKLQVVLGKPITRLNAERGFDHWLDVYRDYLPSSRMRWPTGSASLKKEFAKRLLMTIAFTEPFRSCSFRNRPLRRRIPSVLKYEALTILKGRPWRLARSTIGLLANLNGIP